MNWNINELTTKLTILESLLKKETDNYKIIMLENDIYILKLMINCYYRKNVYENNNNVREFLDKYSSNRIDSACKYVSQCGIYTLVDNLSSVKHKYKTGYKYIDDYDKTLCDFFSVFDENLLNSYLELKNRKAIHSSTYLFDNMNCSGAQLHLYYDNNNYIYVKDFPFNYSVIPHEMGHVMQFSNISNIEDESHIIYSLFRETYPIFIEYVFYDYLKNNGYEKFGKYKIFSQISELCSFSEYYLDKLCSLNSATYSNGEFNYEKGKLKYHHLRTFYSELFALYFYNSYLDNKNKTMNDIKLFNKLVGNNLDEEILDNYSNKELIKSINVIHKI